MVSAIGRCEREWGGIADAVIRRRPGLTNQHTEHVLFVFEKVLVLLPPGNIVFWKGCLHVEEGATPFLEYAQEKNARFLLIDGTSSKSTADS